MEFRSVQQIDALLMRKLPEIAGHFDRLVGCSDEAMVAARLLALHLRLPLEQLRTNEVVGAGPLGSERALYVELAVDDANGHHPSLSSTKAKRFAVYATAGAESRFDLVGECVPSRPFFEWNFLEREGLERVCFDIDGVLCEDPTEDQNDDGPIYSAFLANARPLHRPIGRAGWLVTSRLEKYRSLTTEWMAQQGIEYGELHMIDLPNKEARQAARCHGTFKAEVYGSVDAELFVESNPGQAWEIAQITGKPVFCVDMMQMVDLNLPIPGQSIQAVTSGSLARRARRVMGRAVRGLR